MSVKERADEGADVKPEAEINLGGERVCGEYGIYRKY